MNKYLRIGLIIAAVGAVVYVAYRWYEARQAASGTTGPTGQLGSNLNSVAPELVGGSEAGGTKVSPAVDVPINITMSSSSTMPTAGTMQPVSTTSTNALTSQSDAAGQMGAQPGGVDINGSTDEGIQVNPDTGNGANPVNSSTPDLNVATNVDPTKTKTTAAKKKVKK